MQKKNTQKRLYLFTSNNSQFCVQSKIMKTVNITHIFFEECQCQEKKVKKTGGT